jgi:hypothetical protein
MLSADGDGPLNNNHQRFPVRCITLVSRHFATEKRYEPIFDERDAWQAYRSKNIYKSGNDRAIPPPTLEKKANTSQVAQEPQ